MGVPHVIPNSKLKTFKFYATNAIHEAIFYEGTILRSVKNFSLEEREEAFQFACNLSQEYTTLLSPCTDLYRVWVDVWCPMAFILSFQINF